MGQKKDLSQISTGFEEWLSFFPLQGKKLFQLVHLKLPKDREVPISDKCHCNTECSENLNFYTLEVWSWLLATAGSVWCFKEYWVLQIGTEGVNLLNPLNLWLLGFFPVISKRLNMEGGGRCQNTCTVLRCHRCEPVSHVCVIVEFINCHFRKHIHGTQDFVMINSEN